MTGWSKVTEDYSIMAEIEASPANTCVNRAVEWKDATSYSQGQRGKVAPDAWECTVSGVRVWVGSGHRYYPGEWVMHCHTLGMEAVRIGPTSALSDKDAQQAALTRAASEASKRATKLIKFAAACQEPNHDR